MEENVKLKESPFTGQQEKPSALITYLYIGHFLARWGARFFFYFPTLAQTFDFNATKYDNGLIYTLL